MAQEARRGALAPVLAVAAVLALAVGACRVVPGTTYTGEGTYYAADGTGNCSFEAVPGPAPMVAAMNEFHYEDAGICGSYVRATGPKGTVTVKIVDRCPECPEGDVDFSPAAFDKIADRVDGRVPISWQLVSGPTAGNLTYRVKEGSSPWWLALRVDNHRNRVVAMQVLSGGEWVTLDRQPYNYYVAPRAMGPGPFTVRVADVHGEILTSTGITLSPGVVQPTAVQFAAH